MSRVRMSSLRLSSVRKKTIWRWLLFWTIAAYVFLCLLLFVLYVEPSFLGENGLRIGADSDTYLNIAGVLHDYNVSFDNVSLVSFGGNFFGPVLIAKAVPSLIGIACLNLALFLICLWIADTLPGVRTGVFFCAMVLNPLTTPSLLTLNKEILSFFSIMLFLRYISDVDRSRLLLVAVLLTSYIVRWEQTFVTILFLFLECRWSPLRGRHWTTLILMTSGITLVYPLLVSPQFLGLDSLIGMVSAAEGNVLPLLNNIQAHYGFALIVIPRILINMFGRLLNPGLFVSGLLNADFTDIQNSIAIPFHCVALLVVSMIALFKKKLDIRKQSVYWMAIYSLMTAVTPFLQPRYQFPVYVILCLEISGFVSPQTSARNSSSPEIQTERRKLSPQKT
jgi:hypothetical protein